MSVDEKAIRHYQKREKSCRGCKSNYPISSAMIAPVLPGPRRYSEVFTRGSILYCVARTFNIPSLSRNLLTKDTEDYVTGLEDWAGVAISCTTCAIRGKQRSRIGDRSRQEAGKPAPPSCPPPPPELPFFVSPSASYFDQPAPSLGKPEHASPRKIEILTG